MTIDDNPADASVRLDERLDVEVLRYSRVWEDERLLVAALEPGDDDDVLSIASAGDNCFALLATEARSLTAIDISPAQIALVDLHRAAFDVLDHREHAILVGFEPESDVSRSTLMARVTPQLDAPSRTWFDRHSDAVATGLVGAGRLDRYFAAFHDEVPDLLGSDLLDDVLHLNTEDIASGRADDVVRRMLESGKFSTWFIAWFGRESMERHGRDPEQFRHVVGEVGDIFLGRLAAQLRSVPSVDNPYTWRFFTGRDGPGSHTLALRDPELRRHLRGRLDRLRLLECDLGEALENARPGTWSAVNLSDLFEYVDTDESTRLFTLLAERLRPGARCAWWNLLVSRTVPSRLTDVLVPRVAPGPDRVDSVALPRERTWFYESFHVAQRVRLGIENGSRP